MTNAGRCELCGEWLDDYGNCLAEYAHDDAQTPPVGQLLQTMRKRAERRYSLAVRSCNCGMVSDGKPRSPEAGAKCPYHGKV